MNGPIGMSYDSVGNLYVASIRGNSVIKFTPDGTRSTLASGISRPVGIGVDESGNVYTGGLTSGLITKITPAGVKSTFATGVARAYAIVFDRSGNMLVAERDAGIVSKFTPQGEKQTFLSGLISPFGLLFDPDGNLFISEHDGGQITKVTPEGVRTVFASSLRSPAFMAIEPATGSLANISSRLPVGVGSDVLIAGFIITGTQPKKTIVRAIGPSLPLSGVLSDPFLELHDSSNLIASNDNWRSNQEQEIIATTIPPINDLESAIVATVPANNSAYTAIVRGAHDEVGIGLVEVYDLDLAADSKMGNISTRGFVQGGNNVLIGGFILTGNGGRVVVRAIGPSLQDHGISNALPDPKLTLHNGSGDIIAACDNWRESQETALEQTGLAPGNDLEAAVIATVANGNYTAIVSGSNGENGVALVEIYSVQ